MRLEQLNPKELTLDYVMKNQYELFYILEQEGNSINPYKFQSFAKDGLALPKDNYILVRITSDIEELELATTTEIEKEKKPRFVRTYRYDGVSSDGIVEVETRINGEIRVNFKDKESADLYYNYIRDFFYKSTTGADWLTVSTIFKELKLVNWNPEDCDDWGWPTLDHGTLRHMTDVKKTFNKKMYGFTLSAPQKLYGKTTS